MKKYRRTTTFLSHFVTMPLLLMLTLGLLISCGDSATGSDPESEESNEEETENTTGTIEITTATAGNSTDEDGYTVTLDDEDSQSIDNDATVTFEDLEEGSYSVELSGLASGCTVDGDNPVSADITAEETTTIEFEVTCEESEAEGTIVYYRYIDSSTHGIYTMEADGSNKQAVMDDPGPGAYPAISPDASQIAYSVEGALWVVNIDGSGALQLTSDTSNNVAPAWSPDGSQIVFQSNRDEVTNLYVIDADGSNETRLTNHDADDENPSWSSDGNTIIFNSDRDNEDYTQIHSLDIDSEEVSLLIEATEDNGISPNDPSWSPDGSQIVYQGVSMAGKMQIYIADADGGNITQLSLDDVSAFHPSWSPDGEYITFMALADGNANTTDAIWTVRKDGGFPVRVTDNEEERSRFPSWGPAME